MIGAHQNLNGSRDLITPLSGMVCKRRLARATINLSNLKSLISTHYEIWKAIQNIENGGGVWIVRVTRTGSPEIAPFEGAYAISYILVFRMYYHRRQVLEILCYVICHNIVKINLSPEKFYLYVNGNENTLQDRVIDPQNEISWMLWLLWNLVYCHE